jgi:hypothetical protein
MQGKFYLFIGHMTILIFLNDYKRKALIILKGKKNLNYYHKFIYLFICFFLIPNFGHYTIDIRNTDPILEPYSALLILRELWTSTFRNQILNLLNFSITNLTFTNFLLQDRFQFNGNSFRMCNNS